MTVAMLGNNYQYAYEPVHANGRSYITPGVGCYLGQDQAWLTKILPESTLNELVKTAPQLVNAIQGDTTLTQAQKDAKLLDLAKQQGIGGSWFERNQTLLIAGGVLVLVALVAVQTTKRRRRR